MVLFPCVWFVDIVLSVLKILRNQLWKRQCFVRLCAETTFIKNVSINGQGVNDKKDLKSLVVLHSFRHVLTAVYCRTRWDDGKGKGKAGEEAGEEGYMNLGKMVGASPVRGTPLFGYNGSNG